jgi:hypothetical protein
METANGGTLAETLNDDEVDNRLKRLAWER